MQRASKPVSPVKPAKAASQSKGAAPRASVKKRPADSGPSLRPVQISIFDYAVTIGVLLFQEPADSSAPTSRRRPSKGTS